MKMTNKNTKLKLSNQSIVWEAFQENEKLTTPEILDRVNEKLKAQEPPERMADSTLRRALAELVDKGQLKTYGRQHNAVLYGRPSAGFSDSDDPMIPYAGELCSVENFLALMTNPTEKPLARKLPLLGEKTQHQIRRRMVYAILTAGEPGYSEKLKETNASLHAIIDDLAFTLHVLRSFVDSAVWYSNYRDEIGRHLRTLQDKNPDLFQLAIDYMRSES